MQSGFVLGLFGVRYVGRLCSSLGPSVLNWGGVLAAVGFSPLAFLGHVYIYIHTHVYNYIYI